ncbi:MAG: glycosyl transferase family 28 [Clostridia bacterium]|uniref:glycosyltransferase n=1 Tax=Petroclostridium xylanilyticum TaxID=1792311 RepID=UPI000B97F189|nr:glycosyltransferase [Petroclostridium xylanilyticum]MBZ4646519.1 glycosyl transferase family 28 [Clostridia bacterium]
MNIIISTAGTWGDVLPYISIGTALRKRGHNVVLLANSKFEAEIRKAELGFHSVSSKEDFENALSYIVNEGLIWEQGAAKNANLKKVIESLGKLFLNSTRPIYEYIYNNCQPGNTLLINNYICYGARYAQDKLNIPGITVVLVPFYFHSKYRPAQQPNLPEWMPRFVKRFWRSFFEDFILFKPLFEQFHDGDIELSKYKEYKLRFSPDKVICMTPEWFAKPQPDWPPQTEVLGFPIYEGEQTQKLPREVEEYIAEGEPPIIFNPGSQLQENDKFFIESAYACEKLKKRGIFVGCYDKKVPKNLPSCVKVFRYIPLDTILPRAAAMVYHGGIGTCSQGLRAGIPHLVVPTFPEHYDTAYRLKELGVGDTINWSKYNAQDIANKLDKLINSSVVAKNCREITCKFDCSDPIDDFCNIVEKLARKHGILK